MAAKNQKIKEVDTEDVDQPYHEGDPAYDLNVTDFVSAFILISVLMGMAIVLCWA